MDLKRIKRLGKVGAVMHSNVVGYSTDRLLYKLAFLNLPVWANFYDPTDLSTYYYQYYYYL